MNIPKDLAKKRDDLKPDDLHFMCGEIICGAHKSYILGFNAGIEAAFESEYVLALVEALTEAQQHFLSISSGLTTDINKVEFATKHLANDARIEVFNALAKWSKRNE